MKKVVQYQRGFSNGFFVIDGKSVLAVDCGCAYGADAWLSACQEYHIELSSIRLIVATHGHGDHFMNMPVMRKLTGAPILCHKLAKQAMEQGLYPDVVPRNRIGREITAHQESGAAPWPWKYQPEFSPDLVTEGEVDLKPWGISGKLVETPGHAEGSYSVVLDWGDVICGDIVVEAPPGSGSCGLAYFAQDPTAGEVLFESVRTILASGVTFYSGHGGPFRKEEVQQALEQGIQEFYEQSVGAKYAKKDVCK